MTTLQEAARKTIKSWRERIECSPNQSPIGAAEIAMQAEIDDLRTALAQHREQQGWKRVPVEPTPEMLKAPPNAWEADAKITYAAMLAAAPAPQAQHSQYGSEDLQALILAKLTAPQAQEPARNVTKEEDAILRGALLRSGTVIHPKPAPQPAQGEPTGCACRWDADDNRVATCARHQGWLDVVHEWAERAKATDAALQSAQPKQEPLTDEAIYSIVLSEFKCVPLPYDIRLTRAIEAAHGITGMVEAATRPAIDAASKQGGQHE